MSDMTELNQTVWPYCRDYRVLVSVGRTDQLMVCLNCQFVCQFACTAGLFVGLLELPVCLSVCLYSWFVCWFA